MKKTIVLTAALIFALMLAGCSGSKPAETTAAAAETTTAAAETEAEIETEAETETEAEAEDETTEAATEAAIGENQLYCSSTAIPQYRVIVDKPELIFAEDGATYEYEHGDGKTKIKSKAVGADSVTSYIFIEGKDRETPAEFAAGIHYMSDDDPRYEESTLGDMACFVKDASGDGKTRLEYLVGYELEDGSPVCVSIIFRKDTPDADKTAMAAEAGEIIKHISVMDMS